MPGWWVISYVVLWVLVVALAVTVVALARQIGTLHLRLGPSGVLEVDGEGPPLGEAVPPFVARDLSGREIFVGGPAEGGARGRLLLFTMPTCLLCEQVVPGLEPVARSARLDPVLLTAATEQEARAAYASVRAPVVAGEGTVQIFDVPGTPYAVVLDEAGVVRAKGTVNNLEQLEGLVDTGRGRAAEAESA